VVVVAEEAVVVRGHAGVALVEVAQIPMIDKQTNAREISNG
jgi:hypothetical protein